MTEWRSADSRDVKTVKILSSYCVAATNSGKSLSPILQLKDFLVLMERKNDNNLIGVLINVIIDKFSFCLISSLHANPIFAISF